MLGLPGDALQELSQLPAALMIHPKVLDLHWHVFAAQLHWDAAFAVASELVTLYPEKPDGWVHRAYATRRKPGGGIPDAYQFLLPAVTRFPENGLIRYNLACYAAQMERLDEAWGWFRDAVSAGGPGEFRRLGLADDDLKALWPKISELVVE
jgi:tetratricopeptide (TPR) repeat protein